MIPSRLKGPRHRLSQRSLGTVCAVACLAALVPLTAPTSPAARWWHPGPLTSWAYVIGENYPLHVPTDIGNVQVYDSDLGDQDGLTANGAPVVDRTIESSVAAVHAAGAHAICYVDAGTAEDWRSDYHEFDPAEVGRNLPGWPGEKFINASDWSSTVPSRYKPLETIMADRVALCREEGFDAVEMDNVDAYTYGKLGGFTLSMAQEEKYLDELIALAHNAGMAFFLKNEINGDGLLATMAPRVDGEIDEQCWQYNECGALRPFVLEGKPILEVEYRSFPEQALCAKARAFPMATIHTDVELDGKIAYACWQYRNTAAAPEVVGAEKSSTPPVRLVRPGSARVWAGCLIAEQAAANQ